MLQAHQLPHAGHARPAQGTMQQQHRFELLEGHPPHVTGLLPGAGDDFAAMQSTCSPADSGTLS